MADRLYYADSFLRRFPARVTDIREASREGGQSLWQVALDRTAFYPTGGGQPHDLGILRAASRNGAVLEAAIEAVEEDDSGEVWHFTRKPLLAGTEIEAEIDWPRRLDHIQQHSGQHLLSAVFARDLNAPTVSFHLGDTVSTIDLATGPLAPEALARIERTANELIAEDRPVHLRTVPRDEAQALLAAGHLRKLPEREGSIRIVEIEDCDHNACGGTHVRSTGQIGGLLLRGVEKISRGLRAEFVCGLRAVQSARHDFALLARTASLLSTAPAALPDAVDRLRAETRAAAKDRQKLREELAAYHAARLAVEVPIQNGLRLVERQYAHHDPEYVRLLALRLTASVPQTLALLASTEAAPGRIFLARSRDLDLDCGKLLREALASHGLRGGGSPELAQGDLPRESGGAVLQAVSAAARSLLHRQ